HQNLEGNPHLLEDTPVGRFPEPGERVGDFTIVRELGRGAFAHVYLATDAATGDRPVALKFSLGSSTEARTLGRLVHPNVVPVWPARRDRESNFLVVCMPFWGSATLNDVLHRTFPTPSAKPPRHARVILDAVRATSRSEDPPLVSDLTEPRLRQGTYVEGVLRLGMQLAEALAFLHERGVSHHDWNPSNVL